MRDHLLNPTWISYKSSLMPPYAILLSDHHYSILLEKTASESDAYLSLLDATNPTPTKHRGIICSETAADQLLALATIFCPNAVAEISRQIERQKKRPQT